MFPWKKRMSYIEKQVDASMERFIFQHKVLGMLMIFVGMPVLTLAAVCACTTVIIVPVAIALGWA